MTKKSGLDGTGPVNNDEASPWRERFFPHDKTLQNCVDRIEKYDKDLRALISHLDRDLAQHKDQDIQSDWAHLGYQGPLNYIPIVVKDTICTPSSGTESWDYLPTTCGSFALQDAVASEDATIVKRLKRAGMIIVGKSNVTAFGKASKAGWSAPGGQTKSPYVSVKASENPAKAFQDHDSPSGSSSGSAVAVAASFVSVAISAETEESTVSPAGRAGIFALKASHGSIPMDGIQPYSPLLDCVGVMAQSPDIILPVLNCLQDVEDKTEVERLQKDFSSLSMVIGARQTPGSFTGCKVGMVNASQWSPVLEKTPYDAGLADQIDAATEKALQIIEKAGGHVTRNVVLDSYDSITYSGLNIDQIVEHDFGRYQEHFLRNFTINPAKVTNLQEWVAYNKGNPKELPTDHSSQAALEACIPAVDSAAEHDEHDYKLKFTATRNRAREAIERARSEQGLDVLLGPADSRLAAVASLAGYPIACMPLGRWTQGEHSNGRCFGIYALSFEGRAGELMLLRFMQAWEQYVAKFEPPLL